MPKERFKLIPAVFLLLRKGDEILMMRRFQTGFADGQYGLPSGHVDGGETLKAAMCREAWEEIGVRYGDDDLRLVHTIHQISEGDERAFFFFSSEHRGDEPRNMEPAKCDDLRWFAIDALPENVIPYIAQAIHAVEAGETYGEAGWS